MKGEEAFARWAPEGSPWSTWAKPVLFAADGETSASPSEALPAVDVSWAPIASRGPALVLDVSGTTAVAAGLALVDRGYQPVPLFNSSFGPESVVPVGPLRAALLAGAERLVPGLVAPDAAPAFLLDSGRAGRQPAQADKFDNRWLVFPQDFPSAAFLRRRGIETVQLVVPRGAPVADDLAHVLYRWREGGLRLLRQDLEGGAPRDLTVTKPRGFRQAWRRALVTLRLSRSAAGGFGSAVAAAHGGGFG